MVGWARRGRGSEWCAQANNEERAFDARARQTTFQARAQPVRVAELPVRKSTVHTSLAQSAMAPARVPEVSSRVCEFATGPLWMERLHGRAKCICRRDCVPFSIHSRSMARPSNGRSHFKGCAHVCPHDHGHLLQWQHVASYDAVHR